MSNDRSETILETARVREVVGVVSRRSVLEDLVARLARIGVDRGDIDVMASDAAITREFGHLAANPVLATELPETPRRAVVTRDDRVATSALALGTLIAIGSLGAAVPILATGGAAAAAIAAAVTGGALGGAIGQTIRDRITGSRDADWLENELKAGGIVVFVRVRDPVTEDDVIKEMRAAKVHDVHVHAVDLKKTLDDIPLARLVQDPLLGNEPLGG